jgi:hypothetical protein
MTDTAGGWAGSPPENWFLLMDPAWRPVAENDAPPIEAVVGLWPLEDGVAVGKFRPNPEYLPADENSPSDPLDAVLRLVLRGRAKTDHIRLMLRDTLFDIAIDGTREPLITKSPDDISCVVVATGEPHRARVRAPGWRRIDLDELVELLADEIDVLFNPAGPASVRLTGDFMRETTLMDDDQIAELYAGFSDADGLRVIPWELSEGEQAAAEATEALRNRSPAPKTS